MGLLLAAVLPAHAAGRTLGAGSLGYHGGPVMHVNTTYAIYWVPPGYSVASDYKSLLDRSLGDVAADSGKTSNVYYSDTQYSDGAGKLVPADCDATAHPNNSEDDPTINVVSHEHNEAITDPTGAAWWDNAGYENGDKCAWRFGSSIGSTATGAYNQLINGHPYELQQEYSNARRGCVLTGT